MFRIYVIQFIFYLILQIPESDYIDTGNWLDNYEK